MAASTLAAEAATDWNAVKALGSGTAIHLEAAPRKLSGQVQSVNDDAIEVAEQYEDEFETDTGDSGIIRFEGIVALKELDDPPATGTEIWHEFMAAPGVETDADGEPLPVLRPAEMAFPRAHDD